MLSFLYNKSLFFSSVTKKHKKYFGEPVFGQPKQDHSNHKRVFRVFWEFSGFSNNFWTKLDMSKNVWIF